MNPGFICLCCFKTREERLILLCEIQFFSHHQNEYKGNYFTFDKFNNKAAKGWEKFPCNELTLDFINVLRCRIILVEHHLFYR